MGRSCCAVPRSFFFKYYFQIGIRVYLTSVRLLINLILIKKNAFSKCNWINFYMIKCHWCRIVNRIRLIKIDYLSSFLLEPTKTGIMSQLQSTPPSPVAQRSPQMATQSIFFVVGVVVVILAFFTSPLFLRATGMISQLQRIPPSPALQRSWHSAFQSIVVVGVVGVGVNVMLIAFSSFRLRRATGIRSQSQRIPPSPVAQSSSHSAAQSIVVVFVGGVVVLTLSALTRSSLLRTTGMKSQLQRMPPSPVLQRSRQTSCQFVVVAAKQNWLIS